MPQPSCRWKYSIELQQRKFGSRDRRKSEEEEERMALMWLEAVLPLGIIAGFLCVMGNAQYYIHKAAHGRVFLQIPFSQIIKI